MFASWGQTRSPAAEATVEPPQSALHLEMPSSPPTFPSLQPMASPIDRSVTPKAPYQFQYQPPVDLVGKRLQTHPRAREASDATLDGKVHVPRTSSLAEQLGDLPAPNVRNHPTRTTGSLDEVSSYASGIASSTSIPSSQGPSTRLGGVDSEAAWEAEDQSLSHRATASEAAQRQSQKRRRRIAPPELLVIVRPPPSMQNNPMNLQIQLVMPQSQPSRSGSSRLSGESARSPGASPAEVRNTLRRNNSIGSSKSGRSEVSTAASVASTSSGRRVTPLYNLSFHNILATTVSDAGTDQRVAKYSKKGVEIDGFGLLEPCELVTGYNDLATLSRTRGAIRSISPSNRSRATFNEDASVFSGVRSDSSVAQGSPMATSGPFLSSKQQPPTSFEAMTDEAKGAEANLGGKLLSKFKRFSIGVRPQTPSGAMTTGSGATAGAGSSATVMPGTNTILGKIAAAGAKPDSARPEAQSLGGAVASNAALVLHPPSGEIPQLVPGAGIADGKRTEGYYWTVRKWTRRVPDLTNVANESLVGSDGQNPVLANVWKRFNLTNRMGGNESHPPPGEIPVRFEWARESKRNRMRRARDLRASMDTNSGNGASRRGSAVSNTSSSANGSGINPQQHNNATTSSPSNGQLPLNSTSTGSLHPSMAVDPSSSSRPSSVAGTRSPRRSTDASIAGSSAVDEEEDTRAMDSGSESDPEDSETPWTCHLVLGPLTRIPIGTLSPAPHHPKLVGQLAVPFPLPDLSTTGLGNDGAGLTREELKDIIIVTCLHLIVRESFGGLGKKRKGDNPNGGIPWKLKR